MNSIAFSGGKYPTTKIIDGDTITLMPFSAAKMYAEKYIENSILSEENTQLKAAITVAQKVIAQKDSAYFAMKLAYEDLQRADSTNSLVLQNERDQNEILRKEVKKQKTQKKIIGGVGIGITLYLLYLLAI